MRSLAGSSVGEWNEHASLTVEACVTEETRVSAILSLGQVPQPNLDSVQQHALVQTRNKPDRRRNRRNGQERKRIIVLLLDRYTNVRVQENFPPQTNRLNYMVNEELGTVIKSITFHAPRQSLDFE